jgi:serine/threonine protein phosphatase PrpC
MLRAAETVAKTDTGLQRRDNEDSAYARSPVFVVADGMGGAQAGEVASRIAVETFEQGLPEDGSPEERLASRAREANKRIHELSRTEPERAGMGTTLTAAYVDRDDLSIAHVGDSRAYLFRDGALERLTQDHSLVDELVRRGKLTEEQAAEHPQRSIITRALGPEADVEVDTWTFPLRAGDIVLLCSDGLTSMISEERVAEVLARSTGLEEAAQGLIDEANHAGGRDNITVVLFRLEEVGPDAAVDQPTLVGITAPPVAGGAVAQRTPAPANTATSSAGTPPAAPAAAVAAPAAEARRRRRPRLARTQGPPPSAPATGRRRHWKPVAAAVSTLIVLFLLGGGGWLASRQLFFVGTNSQGVVTIYRGLPYDLPAGIKLYESYYVSGVPVSAVPGDRRSQLLNHHLRSQSDASNLVKALELGQVSR